MEIIWDGLMLFVRVLAVLLALIMGAVGFGICYHCADSENKNLAAWGGGCLTILIGCALVCIALVWLFTW